MLLTSAGVLGCGRTLCSRQPGTVYSQPNTNNAQSQSLSVFAIIVTGAEDSTAGTTRNQVSRVHAPTLTNPEDS